MELQEYHNLRNVEDDHFWFISTHELVMHYVSKNLSGEDNHILDAGCGTGGLAVRLRKSGTVACIDYSSAAIEHCKSRGLINVQQADLNTIDLPHEYYDAITSIDVLYHANISDVQSIITKLFTSLKPGGTFFLHLPAFERFRSQHDKMVHTERRFRLKQTKKLLRDAGFKVTHGSYRITLLLPLILIFRNLSKRESDVKKMNPMTNTLLLWISRFENILSRFIPLPFGLSLYVIAKKPVH